MGLSGAVLPFGLCTVTVAEYVADAGEPLSYLHVTIPSPSLDLPPVIAGGTAMLSQPITPTDRIVDSPRQNRRDVLD